MGGKQFSDQVPLTPNFSGQSMTFYVKKFSYLYFARSRIKLKENNVFATRQYTGATSQAVRDNQFEANQAQ